MGIRSTTYRARVPGFLRPVLSCATVVLTALGLLAVTAPPAGATSDPFTQTVITAQGQTPYSVPGNLTALTVEVIGTAGSARHGPAGGAAADVTATIPVSGGEILYVEIGAGGGTSAFAGAGGGASDVQTCSVTGTCANTGDPSTDPRLVVAGGGGGGGETYPNAGGAGGNAGTSNVVTGPGAGGNGADAASGGAGGDAGLGDTATAASGGAGSTSCAGSGDQGTAGAGGAGEDVSNDASGGGGGGGWVGGSGGGTGGCTGTVGSGGGGGGGGAGASFVESGASHVTVASAGAGTSPEVILTPLFLSNASTTFAVGTAGNFLVTTSPTSPTPSLSKTGSLPQGVTFIDNDNGTASLSGTPAAGSAGQYPLVITGTSGAFTYTQAFTLTVDGPPSITTAATTTFTTGQAGTFTVRTGGYPSPALDESGALPMGVTWVANNDGTATLAGTPASATGGTYPFTITAANGISPNATQNFVLTVRQAASVPADAAAVAEEPNGTVEIAGAGEGAGWHSLGGDAIGTPAVAAIPTISGLYTPLIFEVGTTHALYVRSIGRSWKQLGPSYCYDSPGTTVFNGRLYVACEGRNNILYVGSTTVPTNGALPTISSYQNLGGVLSAGPAIAAWNGVLTFFVSGSNKRIYTRTLTGHYAEQLESCIGHPAAGTTPATGGVTYVACQGNDGNMWVVNSTHGFSGYTNEGGVLVNGPGLAATASGPIFLSEGTFSVHPAYLRTLGASWVSLGGSFKNGVNAVGLDSQSGCPC